jgi:hypothetical protein
MVNSDALPRNLVLRNLRSKRVLTCSGTPDGLRGLIRMSAASLVSRISCTTSEGISTEGSYWFRRSLVEGGVAQSRVGIFGSISNSCTTSSTIDCLRMLPCPDEKRGTSRRLPPHGCMEHPARLSEQTLSTLILIQNGVHLLSAESRCRSSSE